MPSLLCKPQVLMATKGFHSVYATALGFDTVFQIHVVFTQTQHLSKGTCEELSPLPQKKKKK